MKDLRLYVLQRGTAALLAPMILVHLVVIYLATARGLSGADLLSRTHGNWVWGAFYTLFVLAAAVHGAIGIRVVLREWTCASVGLVDTIMWVAGLVLLALGLRAVYAVVLA